MYEAFKNHFFFVNFFSKLGENGSNATVTVLGRLKFINLKLKNYSKSTLHNMLFKLLQRSILLKPNK